jgi:ABC-type multidrug transport system fused ATPase/permease subunit
MNNALASDAVIKNETLKSNILPSRPTDKEIMDALMKQATYAEDYYLKLLSQFQENLRKKYFNL